jgi:DNA recombination protein RmuC
METLVIVVLGLVCAGLGVLAAWLWRARSVAEGAAEAARNAQSAASEDASRLAREAEALRAQAASLREEVERLRVEAATFEERERSLHREREALEKQHATLEARMRESFESLSGRTLRTAMEDYLKRAKEQFQAQQREDEAALEARQKAVESLVKPIGDTLNATRERLERLEKERAEQMAGFREHVEQVAGASRQLREETERLTRALSKPEVRGQYGEIQLRRVAELAGMTGYCDFTEQTSVRDGEGNLLRPDMVVRLPNERVIAVDAKTNTYAYLEAVNARDETEREAHLERFARHVADQAKKLAEKRYWSAWEGSPDFVVMFVPGDHFIDAALSRRPELLDTAAQHGVILASPSTLIGLLRAVAVGWREHRLAEEAQELFALGRELHERAAVAFEHVVGLGKAIETVAKRHNDLVGSIDSRLMPSLRRFEDAGAKSARELPALTEVEAVARRPHSLPVPPADDRA